MLWQMTLLFALAFMQNAAFTWVSRSRNSGDVAYHAYAAACSNAIYFIVTVTLWKSIWDALTNGDWWVLGTTGIVYVAATVLGSCWMMNWLLRTETGKRRVGAR